MTAVVSATEVGPELRLALGRVSRRLRRLHTETSQSGGPSFLETAVLLRLERTGPTTVSELARGERVTTQAVSAAVAGLQRRGLVDTSTDPRDRRRTVVEVNDEGRAVMAAQEQHVVARLCEVLADGFTPAQLRRLVAATPLLDRLSELL